MPLIKPPNDDQGITLEIFVQEDEVFGLTEEQYNRIKNYISEKPWLCPSCGLNNFGHNKKCADFKCRRDKP